MSGTAFFSDTKLQAFAVSISKYMTSFVETGTQEADTARWMAPYFQSVYTCEIDPQWLARGYYEILPQNVYLYNMSSPQFIKEIQPLVGDFPLFHLDAHGFDYWPLQDELKTIEAHYHRAVIIVHDCAVPDRPNFWSIRGGGGGHDGPVLDWDYISRAIDTTKYKLYYPTYRVETPGYCVMFKECEPMGELKDFIECPI